jgi:hypothetical protein
VERPRAWRDGRGHVDGAGGVERAAVTGASVAMNEEGRLGGAASARLRARPSAVAFGAGVVEGGLGGGEAGDGDAER